MSYRGYNTYYEPKGSGNSKGSNQSQGQSRYNKGGYNRGYDRDYDQNYDQGYDEEYDQGYNQGYNVSYVPKQSNKTKEEQRQTPMENISYVPKQSNKAKEEQRQTPVENISYVPKQSNKAKEDNVTYIPKQSNKAKEEQWQTPVENFSYVPKQSNRAKEEQRQTPIDNTSYVPKQSYKAKDEQKQTRFDNKAFPKMGAKEAFPSLKEDPAFPTLGSGTGPTPSTTISAESEWGQHSIVKKKVHVEPPVVEQPTKKTETTSKKLNTAQSFYPQTQSTLQEESFPEPQKAVEQGGKKGKKGKKEPQPESTTSVSEKSKTESVGPNVFQQMMENISTRSNTSFGRNEESKVSYEYEEEGPIETNYEEYEKYMKEGYNEDEDYDFDEGGNYEEEVNYEEAEEEMNKYFSQHQSDRGGGGLVLMVAEKPSIAKSITEALSGGKSKMRKGRSKFCPVYEFSGSIFGRPAYFRVTSVAGHVFATDFPRQYQDWQKVDPLKLFEVETVKKESNPSSRLIQHLQGEARNASYLVLWLDNDKEGENICFEVLDIVKNNMKKESFQQVYRARFSSIVKQDIQEAFRALHSGPNYNESISVDARQIIDLKVGVAFSRFQTMYFTTKYPNLNTKLVTYGPCQTPTLGFCVKRDDEIKNFKPKTFYRVVPTIALPNGGTTELTWVAERTFNQQEAHKVKSEVDKIKEVVVTKTSEKEGAKARPEALNTVQLLRVASAQLGIGPQQAMHIAERLYLSGYLTYPRTESTSYPGKYDFKGIVSSLTSISTFSDYSRKLLQGEMRNPKGGKDVGDHPPITPTNKTPSRESLKSDEWRMYEYVARHFLATISADAKLTKRAVTFQCGQHEFSLNGSTTKSPGFTEIMPWIKLNDNLVPEFKQNQTCLISITEVRTGQTTAPDHLTESELITLMEQNGIGTDASMATHINNICERNYVKVSGTGRRLIPTDLGASLVHGYELIDPDLVAPTLRSNIERSVDMIAKGKAQYNAVLKEMIDIFVKKFIFFKEHINKMDVIFGGSFGTVEENLAQGKLFSKCGKCNRLMKLADKLNKLHCEICKVTLDLPAGGSFKLAGDRKCPLDNFGLLIYAVQGVQNARYYVCPHCYNNSPFPEISITLSCNLCVQEDCQYSVPNNELKDCDLCKEGAFIIDLLAGTKATATCNSCGSELTIAENALNVVRDKKECDSCDAYLFKTIALKGPVQGLSQQKYENVCIFCHKEFRELSRPKPPVNPNPRRGGGRGRRGRGRRGRRGGRKKVERDWRDI